MKARIALTTVVVLALGAACSGGSNDAGVRNGAGEGGTTEGDGGSHTGSTGTGTGGGGGPATGGAGAVSRGGTGGLNCEPPCIRLCQGGICECYCPNTGGTSTGGAGSAGAPTGGANTGGTVSGGAGGTPGTCGGITCGPSEECCGPPECGHCIPAGTDPACAGSCPRRVCGDEDLECLDPVLGYPGEICITWQRTAGPTVIVGYECVRNPCGFDPLDCTCAGEVCEAGTIPGAQCMSPDPDALALLCDDFEGICNSPQTPIATPEGDRPIASLREGDLVYSVHEQAIVAVPLLRTTRTAVRQHRVVRLETEGGVVLEISPAHPTADGRTIGDLASGDRLDGARVVSVELAAYRHQYTHDILPASDTGTYFAGGLHIGTTLVPAE